MSGGLSNLANSSMLPWLILLAVVLMISLFAARASRSRTSTAGRLRELEALRDGRTSNVRYRASTMAVVVEEEPERTIPLVDDFLSALSNLLARLPLLGTKDRENIRDLLYRAGVRRADALGLFMGAKLGSSFICLGIALGIVFWLQPFPDKPLLRVGAVFASMIFGSLLPEFIMRRMIAARQVLILRYLPDALDLMVICTEAGLSLDPTVERVAREMRLSAPELARELALMSHEMRILPKREMALMNFADRNNYREVRSLMSTLVQTLKYGTSLAHSLRVLAAEARNARMLAVEEKAARLPAMMSIPLICFMLPAVFLVIGGPAISQVMKLF